VSLGPSAWSKAISPIPASAQRSGSRLSASARLARKNVTTPAYAQTSPLAQGPHQFVGLSPKSRGKKKFTSAIGWSENSLACS
jgi:hypothetical protein